MKRLYTLALVSSLYSMVACHKDFDEGLEDPDAFLLDRQAQEAA